METEATEWAPIPDDLPELDDETLAAVPELQGGEETEAAARCGERGRRVGGQAFDPLALKAKLACAGALLERGRRFAVARRAGEIVRLAILRIGRGRRDDVRRKVAEGRSLLKSYLGRTRG